MRWWCRLRVRLERGIDTYSLMMWGCEKSLRFWISLLILPTMSRLRIFFLLRILTATLCPVRWCDATACASVSGCVRVCACVRGVCGQEHECVCAPACVYGALLMGIQRVKSPWAWVLACLSTTRPGEATPQASTALHLPVLDALSTDRHGARNEFA